MITDKNGFIVICTNPAKSAAVEACWFSREDWTEEDAMQEFASFWEIKLSEVAVEEED